MAALNVNAPLEKYAKHHTGVFDSLRASIKKEGDMFLFGEPTDKMVKLMFKIYHENILRLLSDSRDKDNVAGSKLNCMFGIMEDTKGNLYVTISESPGVEALNIATDPDYKDKKRMTINVLKSAGINIQFPEQRMSSIVAKEIGDVNRWRKGPGDNFDRIVNPVEMYAAVQENDALKNVMFLQPGEPTEQDVYNELIRDAPSMQLTVNWVDSYQYLRQRRDGGPTFPPFKKYKLNGDTWKAECNNGHLCTESKLFAYAQMNGLTPVSFVAYWIGKELPPEGHIIRSYCYRTIVKPGDDRAEVEAEKGKLKSLAERCSRVLTKFPDLGPPQKFRAVMERAVQPIAVACPGCFANIKAYMSGTMSLWNSSNCYISRRHSANVRGGKRKVTHRLKRKVSKTRKH